jgi:hypothetical protein
MVYAYGPRGDIEGFELSGALAPDIPSDPEERLRWCRRNGQHCATLNTGTKTWWIITKRGHWLLDHGGMARIEFERATKEQGTIPAYPGMPRMLA